MSFQSICHKKHKGSDGSENLFSGYSRADINQASSMSFSFSSWPSLDLVEGVAS